MPALARAANPPPPAVGTYEQVWGVPGTNGQVVIKVTIRVNGQNVTRTVTIPQGAITPFTPPAPMPNESNEDYKIRYAVARGEASQAKAAVIASAINMAFNLTGANRVTTGTAVRRQEYVVRRPGRAPVTDAQNITFGTINIPNAARVRRSMTNPNGDPIEFVDLAGEGGRPTPGRTGGNSGGFVTPPGTSRSTGSLQRVTPGVQTVSTGLDSYGDPSEVDFGIDGRYVAVINPGAGMTDAQVLQDLAGQLDAHGIMATYDPSLVELSLTKPFPDGVQLDWGNTDPGLSFDAIIGATSVPEPSVWMLLLTGLGLAGANLRRRSGRALAAANPGCDA
jgi:hypothetical protein